MKANRDSRRRHSGRRELGNLAALEGVFIGVLMASSIAIVSTMETKPPSAHAARGLVEQTVKDALLGLDLLPTGDRYVHQLDRVVAKSAFGNTTSLDAYLARILPAGAGYRLWLDNGHERRLLAGTADATPRQSVSASRLFHPEWSYAVFLPSLDVVTPGMSLPLEGYAVAQGALVKEGGVPLQVRVTTSGGVYDGAFVTSVRDGPGATLYLLDGDGQAGYVWRDPSPVPTQSVQVYGDSADGPLRASGSFGVAQGATSLSITAVTGGLTASYTLSLTAPGSLVPTATFTATNATGSFSVLSPAAGTWTLTTSSIVAPTYATLRIDAVQPAYNADFTFVVQEEAGKPLPNGTALKITFPQPFLGGDQTNMSQAGWKNTQWAPAPDGGFTITAELDGALQAATRSLEVHADRSAAIDALYLVRAETANGTHSAASFVISGAGGVTTRSLDPIEHRFYVSAPKPHAAGAAGQYAVTFAYPSTAAGLSETVQSVEVWAPGNESVFAGTLSAVSPASGWQLVNPWTLKWTGSQSVAANGAFAFAVRVNATGTPTSDEAHIGLPVKFDNGFATRLIDGARPHVLEVAAPPASSATASDGFPTVVLDQPVNLTAEFYQRSALIEGSATYNVSAFAPLTTLAESVRVGLIQSHVNISKPSVKLGEATDIHVDFQGLLGKVSPSVVAGTWSVDASVYDPSQPFEKRSTWHPSASAEKRPAGGSPPEMGDAQVDLPFQPTDDGFYGPHLVVAQAHFGLLDAVTGTTLLQTARLMAVIDVLPDGGQAETAMYWTILEAWMPDWA